MKKKTILSFVLAVVLMMPCVFLMTACDKKDEKIEYTVSEETWKAQMTATNWDAFNKATIESVEKLNNGKSYKHTLIIDGQKVKTNDKGNDLDDTCYILQNEESYNYYRDENKDAVWEYDVRSGNIMGDYKPSDYYFFDALTDMYSNFEYDAQTKTYKAHFDSYTINFPQTDPVQRYFAEVENLNITVIFENGVIKFFNMTTDAFNNFCQVGENSPMQTESPVNKNLKIFFGVGEVTIPTNVSEILIPD